MPDEEGKKNDSEPENMETANKTDDIRDIAYYWDIIKRTDLTPYERLIQRRLMLQDLQEKKFEGVKNIYQELHMHSRFIDAHRDISDSNITVQLHSHTFIEIIYCISGEIDYLLGTKRLKIRHGNVIIIPPGVSHQPILTRTSSLIYYERLVIWVSGAFIQFLETHIPSQDWSLYESPASSQGEVSTTNILTFNSARHVIDISSDRYEPVKSCLKLICKESEEQQESWESIVCGCTLALMAMLQRISSTQQSGQKLPDSPEESDSLDKILHYIEENLGHKLSLEETAKHFFMSERSLNNLFHARMGTSFYQFVTIRRLIAAKTLLEQDTPPKEIAEDVGFNDYSSFYRAFKKTFQVSPSEYRALIKEEQQLS